MSSNPKNPAVGYKNPPRHTQFKPGESGNPSGRPKGSVSKKRLSLEAILDQNLDEIISAVENGKRKRITMQEAIIKQLLRKAAAGDNQAIKSLLALLQYIEKNRKVPKSPPFVFNLTPMDAAL
jgi:Family of unknown function (DUF5681)